MNLRIKFVAAVIASLLLGCAAAYGQKAEPSRITFAKGKYSATKTGTLSNDQEMDFVFGATKGQWVTITVTSSPKGDLFDFSIAGDAFEIETDQDRFTEFKFRAPETGDYFVFVRKRPTQRNPTAKFYLVLTIR